MAAYAAHYIASTSFPNEQTNNYDLVLRGQLAGVPAAQQQAALAVAKPIALALLTPRLNDSSQKYAGFTFGAPVPGLYQATPGQVAALYPQLANTTTWIIPPAAQFVPQQLAQIVANKPDVTSPTFSNQFVAVEQFGQLNGTAATKYQQQTATFWADSDNTAAITGHLFNITAILLPANITLYNTAQLYAQLAAALFDANVAGWFVKYEALFWRPITAIRAGSGSNAAVPNWTPLLATPAHPDYPSTHSISTGAAITVLSRFLGYDQLASPLVIGSEVLPPLPLRQFTSLSNISIEISNSRVYGGIHFPGDGPNGLTLGAVVGNFVYENFGLLTVPGNSAPSVRPPVNLIFADSSFTVVNGTAVANQYSTSTPAATATAPAPAPAPSAALRPVVAFAGRHLKV